VSREAVRVAIYDPSLAEAFGRFRRAVWPGSGHGEGSAAAEPSPRTDAPPFVFVKGNDIVGHLATIPVQLTTTAGTVAAHWIVGFMVLPEHRNGLVGPLLIREASRVLDCALSLFVEPPVLRILKGMKWTHRGVLPQYLRVLDARAVSRNLRLGAFKGLGSTARIFGSWGLALGQAVWLGLGRLRRSRSELAEVREEQGFDDSYDELWQSVRDRFGACLARDREHLRRRYGGRPERYRVLGCRRENRLLGYCILTSKQFSEDPRMGSMKLGTIVDCLFDPDSPAALQSLLERAVRLLGQDGMHAVLCTASHAAVTGLLRANGFLAIPGNLNFALHNCTSVPVGDIPLDAWHLMRGDSDADQNF
jgi:hypothetical protein